MKKTILLIALFMSAACITFAQTEVSKQPVTLSAQGMAQIEFEKTQHDFKTIKEGTQATVTFTFTNTGDAPLILKTVKASCGCTTPQWSKEPIAPGDSGIITATFNSTGRPGNFTKTITVTHNGETGTDRLSIRGFVEAEVKKPVSPVLVSPQG